MVGRFLLPICPKGRREASPKGYRSAYALAFPTQIEAYAKAFALKDSLLKSKLIL